MKVIEYEGRQGRKILTGLITDATMLARVAAKWPKAGGLFVASWENLVAGWCVDYYRRYEKAPGRHIEGIYASWAEGSKNQETAQMAENFLQSLSDEYATEGEHPNSNYLIDLAGKHFNRVRLARLTEEMQGDLDSGKEEQAEKRLADASRTKVEMGAGTSIDLFHDREAVFAAFAEQGKALVPYPGALGLFFGESLKRDRFVAFQAPDKTGKSTWMLDIAWHALMNRCKVAYFQVGDLSEDEVKMRFLTRAARHPDESDDGKWPYTIRFPTSIKTSKEAEYAQVEFQNKTFKQPLNRRQAWEACERVMNKSVKSKKSYFRLSVHPNTSINVAGICGELDALELDGFTPDVCIIDYADILAPPAGKMEARDGINANWNQMRSLSQSRHCLVVTATQADSESYDRRTQSRRNFSEDKRKLSHVTGMIGINVVDPVEKEAQMCRLNWIVRRKGKHVSAQCVHVAGCLAVWDPSMVSCF